MRIGGDWRVPSSTGLYYTVGLAKQLQGIGEAVSFSNLRRGIAFQSIKEIVSLTATAQGLLLAFPFQHRFLDTPWCRLDGHGCCLVQQALSIAPDIRNSAKRFSN